MNIPRRPSLFIGSSGKSLAAARALRSELSSVADVTLWSEHADFHKVGAHFSDELLKQPERFDFAAMILGPDDKVLTDQGTLMAPRDNVIFELGLFMAHLGPERTFMVVPAGDTSVKVLSDLSGVIWARYDPPEGMKQAANAIRSKIAERHTERLRRKVLAYDGPLDVPDSARTLKEEAQRRWGMKEHVTVWNLALDMSQTWPPLYLVLKDREYRNFTWHSVMLDRHWPPFQEIETEPSVCIKNAELYEKDIRKYCSTHQDELRERNIQFECRTYRSIPVMHGFLMNQSFLIYTILRRNDEGRVSCLENAYLRFPCDNEISRHSIEAYSDWFRYAWKTSERWVWPLK
jgi:Predicted nucleotide-binding protein containing TIR-like domain